jgi:hypothetical protein
VIKKLFNPKESELEKELHTDLESEKKAEIMKEKWRAYDAVGKCHNIAKPFSCSRWRIWTRCGKVVDCDVDKDLVED